MDGIILPTTKGSIYSENKKLLKNDEENCLEYEVLYNDSRCQTSITNNDQDRADSQLIMSGYKNQDQQNNINSKNLSLSVLAIDPKLKPS